MSSPGGWKPAQEPLPPAAGRAESEPRGDRSNGGPGVVGPVLRHKQRWEPASLVS